MDIQKERMYLRWSKGFSQLEGVDFNKIFSLVVNHCFIRILLSIVTQFDLELEQLDLLKNSGHESKHVTTPLGQHDKLSIKHDPSTNEERDRMTSVPFANDVRSIMYGVPKCHPSLKTPIYHENSKHFDVKLHFIRNVIETKEILVEKVATEDNHIN
ncbi:hypothetical protein CR513_51759, partial [Mucuna pruriens]